MAQFAPKAEWNEDWINDTVYLHVFPRSFAKSVVNISPFAIKLELWMRIHKIPFKVIDYNGMGSKGQSPFIFFNGKEIPDSNFIIEYLSEYFHVDPYPGLSITDKAVARAFLKMIEENTSWAIFIYRYVEQPEEYAEYFMPKALADVKVALQKNLQVSVRDRAQKHGIGRHSSEEIHKIGCDDIKAISAFLANKKFLMGDNPSLVDCSLFGLMTQIVCVPMKYPERKIIMEECQNIKDFVDRIIDQYWSEWHEQCEL
ncbi:hypothetical protein ACJMK2_017467 [Sinanodonta woodiana]|uniref:Uncharacterized protein n=1 Tax=Sinanodonta woodiana TaxID=1069815 RepID=A0ABD3UBY4_SINWO